MIIKTYKLVDYIIIIYKISSHSPVYVQQQHYLKLHVQLLLLVESCIVNVIIIYSQHSNDILFSFSDSYIFHLRTLP